MDVLAGRDGRDAHVVTRHNGAWQAKRPGPIPGEWRVRRHGSSFCGGCSESTVCRASHAESRARPRLIRNLARSTPVQQIRAYFPVKMRVSDFVLQSVWQSRAERSVHGRGVVAGTGLCILSMSGCRVSSSKPGGGDGGLDRAGRSIIVGPRSPLPGKPVRSYPSSPLLHAVVGTPGLTPAQLASELCGFPSAVEPRYAGIQSDQLRAVSCIRQKH